MFYVEIGSERPDTEPYFFRLCCNDGSGLYADITTDDIEAFIESHKDATVIKYVTYSYSTIPVEYNNEIDRYLDEIGGIPPKIAYSSVKA